MKTGYTVGDAMTRIPVKISHNDTVSTCAQTMHKKGVGSLLVMDEKTVVGIVTEGDIIRKVLSPGNDPMQTTVKDVMTKDVVSIEPHMDIHEAMLTMNNFDIRHAPVLVAGELAGFLTLKDILKIQPQLFDILVDKYRIQEQGNESITDFSNETEDSDGDDEESEPYY